MRGRTEARQGSVDFPHILVARIYPQVESFGVSRTVVIAYRVTTDQKIANLFACERRQEILEVLVQAQLLS